MTKKQKLLTVIFLTTIFVLITINSFGQFYAIENSSGSEQAFIWPGGNKMALSLTTCNVLIRITRLP